MRRFSDLRSDYPLNFTCFRPRHQSVCDGAYEAGSLVCGFLTEASGRATDLYCTLCYSPARSTQWSGLHKEDVARFVDRPTASGCILQSDDDTHRSIHKFEFEPWLTASNVRQRQPGVHTVRERSRAGLLLTLALHLVVNRCIPEFYLNNIADKDENSIVHRCPTQIPIPMMPTPGAMSAFAAHGIAPYPQHEQQKKGSRHAK